MARKAKKIKRVKLSKTAQRLIAYWRDSLLENDRESLSAQYIREFSQQIPGGDAVRGHCPPEIHRTLAIRREQSEKDKPAKRRGGESLPGRSDPLPVIVCPLRYQRKENSDSGPKFFEALWLPAILLHNGILQPAPDQLPWIPRDVLEPSGNDDYPIIGTLRAVEKFSAKNQSGLWKNWAEYLKSADSFLKAVSGKRMEQLKVAGYERSDRALILLDRNSGNSTLSLIEILEDILEEKISASVLAKLATTQNSRPRPFRNDKAVLAANAMKHLGHFTADFPLSQSQRSAIHRALELRDGEFLSVTGPPGTGKTTVLQSIISTFWVEAALKKSANPPILACTGATNQSVMNIIDCFGRGAQKGALLETRWLPDIRSYGTFCCAATKAEDVRHYQLELKDGSGLSSSMETPDYLQAAEEHYLECFQRQFNSKPSIAGAVKALHRLLHTEHAKLVKAIRVISGVDFVSFLRSLWRREKSHSYQELAELLGNFDTAARHNLFLIAAHYWEARWLLACRALLASPNTNERRGNRLDCLPEAWQRRAMVTPAFVATLSMVPRFFFFDRDYPVPPIDLLIFDEAGQIPVEMGAPCLALAKKALIVGDCLQLEPYWTVQPHIDRGNLHANKIAKTDDDESWRSFSARGLLASNGSLMKLAINSAERTEQNMPGIFLSEQRRSVPELVAFCNTLAYGNRLQPKRAAPAQRFLPAFAYVHIAGNASVSGTSRLNRFEAKEIVNWLIEQEERLLKFYDVSTLADVVAVITPFAAQHRELRKRLPKRFSKMTVGTVNGLQGAERPVVIFSSVYDAGFEGSFFFDQSVNMLNVAVSRARDSFIVFGDMAIFSAEAKTPSGVLAKYLFASPGNELPPAISGHGEEVSPYPPEEKPKRLASLEEHLNTLRDMLLEAKREVIITSGSISSGAIRKDRLDEIIRDTVSRGVQVSIFTDYDLNRNENEFKEKSTEGIDLLRKAGAEVHVVGRIHLKSLAKDGHSLAEGSFNWLSANRHSGNRHQKLESSWLISGPIAQEEIERLKDEMAYRLKAVDDLGTGAIQEEERFF